jgi:hypothetical protein
MAPSILLGAIHPFHPGARSSRQQSRITSPKYDPKSGKRVAQELRIQYELEREFHEEVQ